MPLLKSVKGLCTDCGYRFKILYGKDQKAYAMKRAAGWGSCTCPACLILLGSLKTLPGWKEETDG